MRLYVSPAGPEAIKVDWKRDRLDDAVPASQATLEGEVSPARRRLFVVLSEASLRTWSSPPVCEHVCVFASHFGLIWSPNRMHLVCCSTLFLRHVRLRGLLLLL